MTYGVASLVVFFRPLLFHVAFDRFDCDVADTADIVCSMPEYRFRDDLINMSGYVKVKFTNGCLALRIATGLNGIIQFLLKKCCSKEYHGVRTQQYLNKMKSERPVCLLNQ